MLSVDGVGVGVGVSEPSEAMYVEYLKLYRRIAALVRAGVSDVDVAPLSLVSDTFLHTRINRIAAFDW